MQRIFAQESVSNTLNMTLAQYAALLKSGQFAPPGTTIVDPTNNVPAAIVDGAGNAQGLVIQDLVSGNFSAAGNPVTLGSALATATAFTNPLPLTGKLNMGIVPVTTNIAFSALAGGVLDAEVAMTLQPDGVHAPSFVGMTQMNTGTYSQTNYTQLVVWKAPEGVCFILTPGAAYTPPPTFTAQSPTGGITGVAYSYTYTATGSPTFALGTGSLPAGLSLSSAGVLSGTPTAAGTSSFTVVATNAGGSTPSTAQSVTVILANPSITPTTFTPGVENITVGYRDYLSLATNATPPLADYRKSGSTANTGVGLIGALTLTNATRVNGPASPVADTFTDGWCAAYSVWNASGNANSSAAFAATATGTAMSASVTVPASNTGLTTVRIIVGNYVDNVVTTAPKLILTLSDGSAGPVSINVPNLGNDGSYGNKFTAYSITFQSSNPGATLNVAVGLDATATAAMRAYLALVELV